MGRERRAEEKGFFFKKKGVMWGIYLFTKGKIIKIFSMQFFNCINTEHLIHIHAPYTHLYKIDGFLLPVAKNHRTTPIDQNRTCLIRIVITLIVGAKN